jgi:hypothetical protein
MRATSRFLSLFLMIAVTSASRAQSTGQQPSAWDKFD